MARFRWLKRLKLKPKFKSFDVKVKGPNKLKKVQNLIQNNKSLQKMTRSVFKHKKFLAKVVAVGSVTAYGAVAISNYIHDHSGCFKQSGDTVCKVEALSCCQKELAKGLSSCGGPLPPPLMHACDTYDDEREDLCCRMCSCEHVGCSAGEQVVCKRPTVAEALNHFSSELSSNVLDILKQFVPTAVWWMLAGLALLFVAMFVSKLRS